MSMNTRRSMKLGALALVGGLLWGCLTGCQPSAETLSRLNREADEAYIQVQNLKMQGQHDEALKVLEGVLQNRKLVNRHPQFFTEKIEILLNSDKISEAQKSILTAWRKQPHLARSVLGRIHSKLTHRGAHQEVRAWCQQLLQPALKLDAQEKQRVLGWLFQAGLALGDAQIVEADLNALFAQLTANDLAQLFSKALQELIQTKRVTLAATLLDQLEARSASEPVLLTMITEMRLRQMVAAEQWELLGEAFAQCVTRLDDQQLHKLSRWFFPELQKQNQMAQLAAISKGFVFGTSDKTQALDYAARIWITAGLLTNKAGFPDDLAALLGTKVTANQVGDLFDHYFYELAESPAAIKKLCVTGETLLAQVDDESLINRLKIKLLDGAFITENFDLAIDMLERKLPEKDDLWHEMSIAKVKAHRAETKEEWRAAAQFYREFMDAWQRFDQDEEYDPVSGIAYSKEWILARNAKRVAALLDKVPAPAEAAQARAEAKKYYAEAQVKAADDEDALKLLLKEIE